MANDPVVRAKAMLNRISAWPWVWQTYKDRPDRLWSKSVPDWEREDRDDKPIIETDSGAYGPSGADAEFIASAPELVSALITEIESLRGAHP